MTIEMLMSTMGSKPHLKDFINQSMTVMSLLEEPDINFTIGIDLRGHQVVEIKTETDEARQLQKDVIVCLLLKQIECLENEIKSPE